MREAEGDGVGALGSTLVWGIRCVSGGEGGVCCSLTWKVVHAYLLHSYKEAGSPSAQEPRVLLLTPGTLQAHLGAGRALPEAV